MEKLKSIFNESFNYHLDFDTWQDEDFIEFANDFIDGKTEYYMDDYFIENNLSQVKTLINTYGGLTNEH